MQFKFYVLNYNINKNKVEMFNVFSNSRVNENVEAEIKKYLKNADRYEPEFEHKAKNLRGFDALANEIDGLIMWQEWSRCEYEIYVGSIMDEKGSCLEKWDCYMQAHANIEAIARECIHQYKQHYKIK